MPASAVALMLVAMFSRIAVGAHWLSGTLGGVMYGIVAVALTQPIVTVLVTNRRPKEPTAEHITDPAYTPDAC